jgi:hypothetical protein
MNKVLNKGYSGDQSWYGLRDCADADMYTPQILSSAPARIWSVLPTIPYSYFPEGFGRVILGQCSTTHCSRQERVKVSVRPPKTGAPWLGEHTPTENHASQRHRSGSPLTPLWARDPFRGNPSPLASKKSLSWTDLQIIYEDTDTWILNRPEQNIIDLHHWQLYYGDDDDVYSSSLIYIILKWWSM